MKVVEFIRKYARKSDKSRFSHFCPICSTLTFSSSYFLPLIFFLFLLFSCSTTKKLTEDEVLYVGVKKMKIEAPQKVKLNSTQNSAASGPLSVKPNNPLYSPYVSDVICLIIKEIFDPAYVSVVTGGRAENNCLLNEHFDYIFFTGSQAVGKEVMRKAAEYLTPVTLELGGKSPCIVTESADLKLAARRIVFGKFLNCGQTCVAPDYIYVQDSIKDQLVKELINETKRQFTDSPLNNNDYGKIVNEKHFNRISGLIDNSKVVLGGASDADSLRIEPTIMDNVTFDDAVMQEEIFGPLMPILTFHSVEEAVNTVNAHMHPLALYIFTKNKKEARYVTSRCNYGGGCINDTIIHLATSKMGFGGFGESGMGSYHGKAGFDTFSHYKSIVDKKCWLDLPMRYQPYTKSNNSLIHMFLK